MSDSFEERLNTIEQRIVTACKKAGRDRESVRLLAVSKTRPPEAVREAVDCGLRLFGENRVQEAQSKISMSPSGLEWHLIGHLQTNKAKVAARLFQMVHSVDSLKLLQALESHAGTTLPVLLQVNVSGEASKFGMEPSEVADVIDAANQMPKVRSTRVNDDSSVFARPRKNTRSFCGVAGIAGSLAGRDRNTVAGVIDGNVARFGSGD